VTWSFAFLAVLLVGLVMASTSGLLRRIAVHHLDRHITVPAPEHHTAVVNLIAQRVSMAVTAFGLGGLVLLQATPPTRLVVAAVAALATGLVALLVLRPVCPPPAASLARVVREIPPGGYGQVEIEQGLRALVLAARAHDGSRIATGTVVDLLDCESSVVTVRPRDSGQ